MARWITTVIAAPKRTPATQSVSQCTPSRARDKAAVRPSARKAQAWRGKHQANTRAAAVAVVAWPDGNEAQPARKAKSENSSTCASGSVDGRMRPIAFFARLARPPLPATA